MSVYTKKFEDPAFWHPKCKNFEIFDWKKWEAKNVVPPKIFDPPQRHTNYVGSAFIPLWWWHRSCYFQPLALCWHQCCSSGKEEMGRITDKSMTLYKDLLRPHPDSSKVPTPLRNALFWTQNNIAAETLISFNRYAWRSQTEEGRVIGVGHAGKDFTSDATLFGAIIANRMKKRFSNVQQSPDGKWFLLNFFFDPNDTEEECTSIFIYVIQEGDVFKTPTGEIIDYVKPGDILRLTYNTADMWDTSKLKYVYFPRKVATLDEVSGEVRVTPVYEELLEKATNKPGQCCTTCCYTCMFCKSAEERFDFQVNHISDLQVYGKSFTPPSGDVIERL